MLQTRAKLYLDPHSLEDLFLTAFRPKPTHEVDSPIAAVSRFGDVVVGVDHGMPRGLVPIPARDRQHVLGTRQYGSTSADILHPGQIHALEPSELGVDGRETLQALCHERVLAEFSDSLL